MSFHDLRLVQPIVRAVTAAGYETPTPIQAQAIPEALAGRDVLGCAQTGTGKTCAFALPILQRLDASRSPNHSHRAARGCPPRALVLCPTRELASQIFDSFVTYGRNLSLKHTVVFGGVGQGPQVRALRSGIDVLVATPGRLLDLINQGHVDLRSIEVLVLDEADRMLDMGFINDIRKVIALVPDKRQTLFFSATISNDIARLAGSILKDPVRVEAAPEATTADLVSQSVYLVEKKNKPLLLERLLRRDEVARVLVFTRTKYGADKLTKVLRRVSIQAEAIHGNKSQNARTRALDGFKAGKISVLIATDVASRGIDVDDITHVVNYDMPIDADTYVHRIGRTARAGASGVAISFCDHDNFDVLRAIERRTRQELEIVTDEADLVFDAPRSQPKERPAGRSRRKPSGRGSAQGSSQGANGNKTARRPRKPRPTGKAGRKPRPSSERSRDERPRDAAPAGRSGKPVPNGRTAKPDANASGSAKPKPRGKWHSKKTTAHHAGAGPAGGGGGGRNRRPRSNKAAKPGRGVTAS